MKNKLAFVSILFALTLTACGGGTRRTRTGSSTDDDWWYSSTSRTSTTTSYYSESSSSFELVPGHYLVHAAMVFDECTVKEKHNYAVVISNVYNSEVDGSWGTFTFDTTTENTISFFSNARGAVTVDLDLPGPGEWWVQIGQYQVGDTYGARFLNSSPDSPYYDNRTGNRTYTINVPEQYNYYYCWGAYWTNVWPGDPLVNHQARFSTEYDGVVNIIFNYDGMVQTDDLTLPLEGGTYTWTGSSFIRG